MLRKIQSSVAPPREGDLFKVIHLYGRTFEIRYGFYEECDRHNQFAEPVEIYPDFFCAPQYTDEGIPFITAIQSPCTHFVGNRDANSTCEDCNHYRHGEELLGTCACPQNRLNLVIAKEDKEYEKNNFV